MQVSEIITRYGVLKNPSAIETRMILTNPINAKAFIEKPFEKFCQRVSQDKEFRNSLRVIHKGQSIPIDTFIHMTESKTIAREERAKKITTLVNKINKSFQK